MHPTLGHGAYGRHVAGRPIEFAAYHQRYVALEIAYLGWDHHGFASQADTDNTIEVVLSPGFACSARCGVTWKTAMYSAVPLHVKMLGLNLSITTACTLQGYLWAALRRLRLVPEDCDWHVLRYSRCGRTDKGVSALGQVGRHYHGNRVMQARQADV